MGKLTALLEDSRRQKLAVDVVALVELHIAQRSGVRGVALRAAMVAVRRRLPDAIPRTVDRLLPDFIAHLEPLHQRSRAGDGRAFAQYLKKDKARSAEAMLTIADARVERSSNGALKAFYAGFRGIAEREAEELVPGLADLLARHLG